MASAQPHTNDLLRGKQENAFSNMWLNTVFMDIGKAFGAVNREPLWTILVKLGCPMFHDNMTGQVLCNADYTNSFNISSGV